MKWISTASLLLAISLEMAAGRAFAQQPGGSPTVEDLSARADQQSREIQQLQAQINDMQRGTNATAAAFAPAPGAPGADAPKPASDGAVVGSDMSVKAVFKDGEFLWFETPNKDFTMHLGGWIQWDSTWWTQPTKMKAAQGKASAAPPGPIGIGSGGIGPLQDGEDWRRVRIVMEGVYQETYEYRFNFALENDQFSTLGLDEFWVADNQIPVIGTIRGGHAKCPMGLEADMYSSSRAMNFLERSSYSEAIELNQNFVTGVWFTNTALDERASWAVAAFRPDNGNSGDFYGTDQLGAQGRFTVLPIYEDEGRHLLHLAISGGWRNGASNSGSTTYTGNTVTLQARPELRDDDPGAQTIQPLPNANDNRMVSTGPLATDNEVLMGLEMLYIRGPWSLQAEYGWNWVDNARAVFATSTPAVPVLGPKADYMFDGGYVMASWMITGENRAYDKKNGALSRYYLGSKGPYENAFLVRDENGCWCSGLGAWELDARFSYINLNDGSGLSRVNGGIMDGISFGVNWYLNSNTTILNEVSYNNRYDVPATTVASYVRGYGMRLQLSW